MEKKYDLDERLINFASDCIDISEGLPKHLLEITLHPNLFVLPLRRHCIMEKPRVQKAEMTLFIK